MMSLLKNLRVALVCLTLSVVGCFSKLPVVGDASGKNLQREDGILQLENSHSVTPQSKIPMRSTFQRNVPMFESGYQASRVDLAQYSQRNDGNAKRTSFSYTEPRHLMDAKNYHVSQPKINSGKNPDFADDNSHGKNRYAFQRLQQNPNALKITRSHKSTIDTNSASGIIKNEGLVNKMYASNVYLPGLFSKSESEMNSDSTHPFKFNLRSNISVQPVISSGYAKKSPADYMYRNLNVNHNMRLKNNESILYDGQKMLRTVTSVGKPLVFVRTNQKVDAPLPHASSTRTTGISQISNDNIKPVGLSKVFAMPKPLAFTKSHSDGIQSILPLKKANLFSHQRDQVGQDYTLNVSPKANQQSNFEFMNVPIKALKGFPHESQRASQGVYPNSGHSRDPIVQDLTHSQREYEGTSAIRPQAANASHSYRPLLSAETNDIQTWLSVASIRPKQSSDFDEKSTKSFPRIQMPLVIPEPETIEIKNKIKLPATGTSSLWMSSQHSTGRGNYPISSGQSTAQSLFINNPMPSNTIKVSQSTSQSVSGTQGILKNSDMSTSENRPYYLTSKKPYAFKGFTFFPVEQAPAQQTAPFSGPKRPQSPLSNAFRHASVHPYTALSVSNEKHHIQAQNPLIPNSLTKPHKKQFDLDLLDAVRSHDTVSSSNTSKHHRVVGQAMKASLFYPSSTTTSTNTGQNNRTFYLQNDSRRGSNDVRESQSAKCPLETTRRTTGNVNTLPEFPSLQGTDFTHNIQLSSRHRNDETISLRLDKFNSGKKYPLSRFLPSINRSSVPNKVTGYPLTLNAAVQPHSGDVQTNIKVRDGLFIPSKEMKDSNSGALTQININKMQVKAKEGDKSKKNPVYVVPIYRSAKNHKGFRSAKTVHLPTRHKSVIKPYGKAKIIYANVEQDFLTNETRMSVNRSPSEMDIDLSAIGVSQTFRPTSSFVVGKYVSALGKKLTKSTLSASRANGLHNFKPVRFADVKGSASFSNIKPRSSAVESKVALRSILKNSTPGMDKSFTEHPFADNFPITTVLQENIKIDRQNRVTTSIPGFMPKSVITEPQPSLNEVGAAPQTTSELEPDTGNQSTPTAESITPFKDEVLIPNTTMLVTMTSD